jgi:hypothetical protein
MLRIRRREVGRAKQNPTRAKDQTSSRRPGSILMDESLITAATTNRYTLTLCLKNTSSQFRTKGSFI